MSDKVTSPRLGPSGVTLDKSPDRIARMFDAIAPRYDLLNRLLSAGIDRRWRAAAVRSLELTGRETLVDVCAGTADVALEAVADRSRGAARAIGIDFSGAMLRLGLTKVVARGAGGQVTLVRGDATRIPAADRSVDAITIAFGIRNVDQVGIACAEMHRVLKPGGRLAILEFAVPTTPGLSAVYLWYLRHVLPRIGRAISRHHAAYGYLPASIGAFTAPEEFVKLLRQAGFVDVEPVRLTFGAVILYTACRGD